MFQVLRALDNLTASLEDTIQGGLQFQEEEVLCPAASPPPPPVPDTLVLLTDNRPLHDDEFAFAGAPAGFPNPLTSQQRSNPANLPGSQTMPKCRFNEIWGGGLARFFGEK